MRRSLRECFNSRATINKLSTELLCQIFHEATPGHCLPSSSHPKTSIARFRQILCITHICRTWRSIALDIPSLWTEIYDKYIDVYHTVLKRSKNAPVCLKLGGKNEKYPRASAPSISPSTRYHVATRTFLPSHSRCSSAQSYTANELRCLTSPAQADSPSLPPVSAR